jgi:protein SCO1/2
MLTTLPSPNRTFFPPTPGHRCIYALSVALLLLTTLLCPTRSCAEDGASAAKPATKLNLIDVDLIDVDGKPVRLVSEAIADRLVVIDFVYTACGTVCPLLTANFKKLQDKLGKRLGEDVWLISISLDPETDTPKRLKEYAARYRAKPGWIWLTGARSDIDRVLKGLGTSTANFQQHSPLTLVGDGKHGTWTRFNTVVGPALILSEVDKLASARRQR